MSFAFFTNLRAVVLSFCIVAGCVGTHGKQMVLKDNDDVYLTLWESKNPSGSIVNTGDLNCDSLRIRMRSASVFSIIAISGYFLMLLLCLAELVTGPKRALINIAHYVVSFITFAFALTTWALVAAAYHRDWCGENTQPSVNNFKFDYGFALLVSMWCAHVLNEVIRIIAACCYSEDSHDAISKENAEEMETKEEREARRQRKRERHAARRAEAEEGGKGKEETANSPDKE